MIIENPCTLCFIKIVFLSGALSIFLLSFQTTHVFDNAVTVIFAVFMSIWGTVFLEGWKRYLAEMAWDWDVQDFEVHEVSQMSAVNETE